MYCLVVSDSTSDAWFSAQNIFYVGGGCSHFLALWGLLVKPGRMRSYVFSLAPGAHLHRSCCPMKCGSRFFRFFSDIQVTSLSPGFKQEAWFCSQLHVPIVPQDPLPSRPMALSLLSSFCFWATMEFIWFLHPARSFQYFLCVIYHCSVFAAEKGTAQHES